MKRENKSWTPEYASLFDQPREIYLSYAAGLIDGEGCIGMYWNKVTDNYQLRITVEMGNKAGLLILQSLFEGKWYHKNNIPPRREVWSFMLFGSAAEKALKELLPYLHVKKQQATCALICDWSSFIGKELTEKEKELRSKAKEHITILNSRGYYEQ